MSAICECANAVIKEAPGGKYCEKCNAWWRPEYGSLVPGSVEAVAKQKRMQALPRKKIGRNDLCPCGSGEKYKKCCGY